MRQAPRPHGPEPEQDVCRRLLISGLVGAVILAPIGEEDGNARLMSNLVVVAYNDEYRAAEALATLRRLDDDDLIDLEDAVVVTKDAEGKITIQESQSLTAAGVVGGGFWGLLTGAIFFAPVVGAMMVAQSGARSRQLSDLGVHEEFVRATGEHLAPRTSELFVLVRSATPERVVQHLAPFGGEVLRTTLTPDTEAKLRRALNERP